MKATSWSAPRGLDFEAWVEHGRRLGAFGRAVGWRLGDWLNYGNLAFGEKYARAARITGYDVQSLMNMAYVGSRFPISRRREILSWSHHAELAALPASQQEHWLDRCAAERLSVRDLRTELRTWRRAAREESHGDEPAPDLAQSLAAPAVCPACGFRFVPERQVRRV